jgi:ssDNA-binding Zn-finger/Zn-ribbon topoisomerase 1
MSEIKPQHRPPFQRICRKCGSKMTHQQFPGGHSVECDNQNCTGDIDVPYGGYVAPIQQREIDRELE